MLVIRRFQFCLKLCNARYNHSVSKKETEKWDLMCSVCLERKPKIAKPLNEIELAAKNWIQEVEFENSMKSDHEMRLEKDAKKAIDLKEGKINVSDMEKTLGQTGFEFEDQSRKEFLAFKPASGITEADTNNDNKSVERSLEKHLVFITKENVGKDNYWLLPQDKRKEGETLRQTAERIIKEKCGQNIKAKFYGNAPCGFYKYKYPKEIAEKQDIVGSKIFFYKAKYLDGEVDKSKRNDFQWATRNELSQQLFPKYHKSVQMFLVDE